MNQQQSFSLSNFEGPLELLLYLIQKEEMDVCEIALKEITTQFFAEREMIFSVDQGADFLAIASTLLLLKSRKLLPQEEGINSLTEEEDPRFSLIQHLLEYCRFKEVAEDLSHREEKERVFFPRAASPTEKSHGLGLEEIALPDLVTLLQEVLKKASKKPSHLISDDEWQVAPKIVWLEKLLSTNGPQCFKTVFSPEKCREELICIFLALLELMKHQKIRIKKEADEVCMEIFIPPTSYAPKI